MRALCTYLFFLIAIPCCIAQKQFVSKNYQLNKKDCIVGFIPVNDSIFVKQLWGFVREDKSEQTIAFDLEDSRAKVYGEQTCNQKLDLFIKWLKANGEKSISVRENFDNNDLQLIKSCLAETDILIFLGSLTNKTIYKQSGGGKIKTNGNFKLVDLNTGDIILSKNIKTTISFKGSKEDWGPNSDRVEIKQRNSNLAYQALIEKFSSVYNKEFIKRNNLN